MKITKATVKTQFEIEIEFKDFADAFVKYGSEDGECYRILYPKAFEGEDLEDTTVGSLREIFKTLNSPTAKRRHGDTYAYLAKCLGFDGWENAGYYHEPTGRYRFSVYVYGDYATGGWKR